MHNNMSRIEVMTSLNPNEIITQKSKFEIDCGIYSLRMALHTGRVPNNIYYQQIKPLRKTARSMNKQGRG